MSHERHGRGRVIHTRTYAATITSKSDSRRPAFISANNNWVNNEMSTVQSHLRLLRILSPTTRLFTIILIHLLSILPLFDSSPSISSSIPSKSSSLLRWDAFHFANIAQNGYVPEYEWAFFPGTPLVMRIAGEALRFLKGSNDLVSWDDLLQGGAIVAFVCDVDSTIVLYHLTLHHLGSTHIALITSVLSLLPSSPATLRFAAYSEPFFTYLSYKGVWCLLYQPWQFIQAPFVTSQGMLSCARSQWLAASIYFALAATFRSNGILLSGFILWGLIIDPFLHHKRVRFRILHFVLS
jgi:GPI mannosyltransferase 2